MTLAYKVLDAGASVEVRFGSADPTTGAGDPAPTGSVYLRNGSVGRIYWKYGAGNTDWALSTRLRLLASGTTTVPMSTTVTVGPFTRLDTERVSAVLFATNNVAGVAFSGDLDVPGVPSDSVQHWFERTVNANEFNLRLRNNGVSADRTAEWTIFSAAP